MRFMLPESAKNYFSNIMRREGSHTSDEKNKQAKKQSSFIELKKL